MRFKSRRPAREAALKALYQMDIGKASVEDAVAEMRENAAFEEALIGYAEMLIRGVQSKEEEIKKALEERLEGWDYSRLAVVDRCLLRIAAYELLFAEEVPAAVAMNEAIEIAKKYSTAESGKFVNGVLANLPSKPSPPASQAEEFLPTDEALAEEKMDESSPEWVEIAKSGALVIIRPEETA